MAQRNGVTLIVTILHCTPLTEVTWASKLLDWGFSQDGAVRPVGTLVSPKTPAPASPAAPGKAPRRPVTSGTITAHGAAAGLAAAVIALAACAAVAALAIVRRRRAPSRR
jgi:D-alanyl-D-alanine carboxypeptidase (penicillin-binding protein 5/6)